MLMREKLVKLFTDFFIENGAKKSDLGFLESLPLEVSIIRNTFQIQSSGRMKTSPNWI